MTISVEIEGKGMVAEFPDGTDPQVIDAAIKRDYFGSGEPEKPKSSGGIVRNFVRPAVETGGLLFGGAAGLAAGGPLGSAAGAGLGYGIAKRGMDMIEGVDQPKSIGEALVGGAKDVGVGMATEMAGGIGGKVLSTAAKGVGAVGKQVIGRVTGSGPGAVEEAVKGSKSFTDAMRGKISGDDIVQNAKDALSTLKERRADAYRGQLEKLEGMGDLDIKPITDKAAQLMKKYNIKINPDGTLDYSRTAVGRRGNADLEGVMDTVVEWGMKPGDKTPLGLDTLKRQLDDFYSESSAARGFVSELRNEVKNTIVKQVPRYGEMTKGYSEATNLIKDLEQGLSLKKTGMNGRVVADQTLRRLTSSMRDNFQLRRELVDILSDKSGQDLSGQIGGLSMSELLPKGLAGQPLTTIGLGYGLSALNPKFIPLLAASSPRVAGEFLRMLGKLPKGGSVPVGKAAAYMTVPPALNLLSE